ncbi:hypothetical protein [Streptomyces nanshensis]|uniref:Uncharacterized protein n=1 Tax=Streptomyces nanshensis TaxID=518642 RepID=A0A1E7L673_9ACTN|nr:hypothetical protein [Streptomyces nanshensis]OEV11513.1 hypothetical protein AN218_12475 [Streptomyces nanshensis]
MPRTRYTTTDLHNAVHALLEENPLRADDGHPEFRLFVYHGKPVGLDAPSCITSARASRS